MAAEPGRRLLLIVAVVLCQMYAALRAVNVQLDALPNVLLKSVPVLLLSFVALTAPLDPDNAASAKGKIFTNRIGVGLGLSAIGDAALEIPDGFLAGLGFFLLAHISYSGAFAMDTSQGVRQRLGGTRLLLGRFMMMFWSCSVGLLYSAMTPHIPEKLRWPVALYVCAIAIMVYRAVGRYDPVCGATSYNYSLVGAVAFAASDMLLAYNMFVEPIELARSAVMVFYYAGQVCMATSTIFPAPSAGALSAQATSSRAKAAIASAGSASGTAATAGGATSRKRTGKGKRRS